MKILKKALVLGTVLSMIGCKTATVFAAVWPMAPTQYAEGAIVMDADTGAILYGRNIHGELYPASTTKIMTVLLALENGQLDDKITFSHNSVFDIEAGSSIVGGIDEGDVFTMEQCLYGIMLCSGNETAYAVAEQYGGSLEGFSEMMNERAKELGCENTNFTNPHGLQDANHYTSAYDLALISKKALEYDSFREIASTSIYTFPPTKSGEERRRANHHRMLPGIDKKYTYDDCIGGKTGYTVAAQQTLVTFAERNGMTLICVVLKEQSKQQWADTKTLLDFSFDKFKQLSLAEACKQGYSARMLIDCINEALGTDMLSVEEDANELAELIGSETMLTLPQSASLEDVQFSAVCQETEGGHEITLTGNMGEEHEVGKTVFTVSPKNVLGDVTLTSDFREEGKAKKGLSVLLIIVLVLTAAVIAVFVILFLPGILQERKQAQKRKEIIERRRQARIRREQESGTTSNEQEQMEEDNKEM